MYEDFYMVLGLHALDLMSIKDEMWSSFDLETVFTFLLRFILLITSLNESVNNFKGQLCCLWIRKLGIILHFNNTKKLITEINPKIALPEVLSETENNWTWMSHTMTLLSEYHTPKMSENPTSALISQSNLIRQLPFTFLFLLPATSRDSDRFHFPSYFLFRQNQQVVQGTSRLKRLKVKVPCRWYMQSALV